MWQETIVGLAVAAAAWFVGRRLWRTFGRAARPGAGPGCGCGGDGAPDCASCVRPPEGGEPPAACGACQGPPRNPASRASTPSAARAPGTDPGNSGCFPRDHENG